MGRLPSKSGGAAYCHFHCRPLRPVCSNIVINNFKVATASTNERYVRCAIVSLFIMFSEYMFRCCLFLFNMLFSIFSMFELHVVVTTVVVFNILELIMKIVLNYPRVRPS
jgi:hypothetical protein